jgi:autotransporter-associated beta strand protein
VIRFQAINHFELPPTGVTGMSYFPLSMSRFQHSALHFFQAPMKQILRRRAWTAALVSSLALIAGAGGISAPANSADSFAPGKIDPEKGGGQSRRIPPPPPGAGYTDSAPIADENTTLPFVDYAFTNQRGNACYSTEATNAGVRVVSGFLDIWRPRTLLVDAGVSAPANGTCPAVTPSTWTGIPGDPTNGTVLNVTVHSANILYVINATASRTSAQELAAYVDDRRGKGYSVTDGLGPLTSIWRAAAQQTTTITGIPADATSVLYNDGGNNTGVGSAAGNATFGSVVDFINNIGENGSTEPAKRFYKYARPWRWSSSVQVVPALVPAESSTPRTDGGFISGHAAEATRDAIAMAYVVPERFQELLTRALELGENRILAGMHSPLDVIGGRIQAQAVATASLVTGANSSAKAAAYAQARTTLMAAAGVSDEAGLDAFAHSQGVDTDRFADHETNKANYLRYMTHGFSQIGDETKTAFVPKGAEALLETRLPYLDAEQRRVVLKTTAIASGYPVLDDAEGWGRLNLFAAADGYGAFNGDVIVTMDASYGGFQASDSWRNDICGVGKLTKQGTGTLKLLGANRFSGGTEIQAGVLEAGSATALGTGDVYVSGGTLVSDAASALDIDGDYTQFAGSTLELKIGEGSAGRLNVRGAITLVGATLHVKFEPGYQPPAGAVIRVINGRDELRGRFKSITIDGLEATAFYVRGGLLLRIDD